MNDAELRRVYDRFTTTTMKKKAMDQVSVSSSSSAVVAPQFPGAGGLVDEMMSPETASSAAGGFGAAPGNGDIWRVLMDLRDGQVGLRAEIEGLREENRQLREVLRTVSATGESGSRSGADLPLPAVFGGKTKRPRTSSTPRVLRGDVDVPLTVPRTVSPPPHPWRRAPGGGGLPPGLRDASFSGVCDAAPLPAPAPRIRFSAINSGPVSVENFKKLVAACDSVVVDVWNKNGRFGVAVKEEGVRMMIDEARNFDVAIQSFREDCRSLIFRGVEVLNDADFLSLLGCVPVSVMRRGSARVVRLPLKEYTRLLGKRIVSSEHLIAFTGTRYFEERRCYRCLKTGHLQSKCGRVCPVCPRCGSGDHTKAECSAPAFCVRCEMAGHAFYEFGKCPVVSA